MKVKVARYVVLAALAACGTSGGTSGGGGGGGATATDAAAGDGATAATTDTQSGGDGATTTDTTGTGDGKVTDTATPPADTATSGDTGGGADTGGPVGKPVPLEQLEAELLKAMCQSFVNCGGADISFASVDSCVAFLGSQFSDSGDSPTSLIAEVKAGKITYDPVAAGNCLAYFATTCGAFKNGKSPPPCKATFVGKIADGQPCNRDEVCTSGRCEKTGQVSSDCPGKCAQPAKAGGACNSDSDCDGELLCINDKCAAKGGKAGAACNSESCDAGLFCDYSSPDGAKCAALGKVGGACIGTEACEKGLYCKAADSQGVCTKPTALGGACTALGGSGSGSGPGGGFGECGDGVCLLKAGGSGGEGLCATKAKLGQPCQGPGQCIGIDTWCPAEGDGKGTCKLLPAKGKACQQPDFMKGVVFTCQLPFTCDPATKVCVDPPGEGKPCLAFCAPGLDCNQGKCTAKAKAGESCENANCASGLECSDGKCAKPVCGG